MPLEPPYTIDVSAHLRSQKSIQSGNTGVDEEEKKDQVVQLEDIINDIYKLKFKDKKKRTIEDLDFNEKSSEKPSE